MKKQIEQLETTLQQLKEKVKNQPLYDGELWVKQVRASIFKIENAIKELNNSIAFANKWRKK